MNIAARVTLRAMDRPEIIVLSGPNGAGKSTTATLLLPESLGIEQFVNADLIAQGLSPFAPGAAAFAAGRIMLRRIRELRALRHSFAFETTLATRTYVPFLRAAQNDGYLVHLVYHRLEQRGARPRAGPRPSSPGWPRRAGRSHRTPVLAGTTQLLRALSGVGKHLVAMR